LPTKTSPLSHCIMKRSRSSFSLILLTLMLKCNPVIVATSVRNFVPYCSGVSSETGASSGTIVFSETGLSSATGEAVPLILAVILIFLLPRRPSMPFVSTSLTSTSRSFSSTFKASEAFLIASSYVFPSISIEFIYVTSSGCFLVNIVLLGYGYYIVNEPVQYKA